MSPRPMDQAWANEFKFTNDLTDLEQLFYEEHQNAVKRQMGGLNTDQVFLHHVSETIAKRLGDQLSNPDTISEYMRVRELEKDSRIMASHIQELLKKIETLEAEKAELIRKQGHFERFFGNLYIKHVS